MADDLSTVKPAIIGARTGDEPIRVTITAPDGAVDECFWQPHGYYELVLTEGSIFAFDTTTPV